MKFVQHKDGSAEIWFSDEEIKIFKETKKLILSREGLRHFTNHLVNFVAKANLRLPDELQKTETREDHEVNAIKPKSLNDDVDNV